MYVPSSNRPGLISAHTGLLGCALALALAAACTSKSEQSGDPMTGELQVFAAASLTDAFTELARAFERANPNVKVALNFAGSQSLRTQIENGASPGVFASANQDHMALLVRAELIDEPAMFAHNEMVIAVPRNNPAGIEQLGDLVNARRLVLAGSNVPAGAYAETVLDNAAAELGAEFRAQVMARVVSRELHVRHTLQKVALGEADAAVVYATDAAASDQVDVVRIPEKLNVIAAYPIAVVRDSAKPQLARKFVEFVRSEPGQRQLSAFGFRSPGNHAQ